MLVGLVTSPLTVDDLRVAYDGATEAVARIPVGDGLVVGAIGFLYYWLLQSFWNGQTVGKRLFGMRVVRENGEAKPVPGRSRCGRRWRSSCPGCAASGW